MLKKFWREHKIISCLLIALVLIFFICLGFYLWVSGRIDASLPARSGTVTCSTLVEPVLIDWDKDGVPTISGQSLEDVLFAQGYIMGQERFFQMDICRRYSAGELSALMGPQTLGVDIEQRKLGYRKLSIAMITMMQDRERVLFSNYVAGINAGLKSLGDVPPEYLALMVEPQEWTLEDTMLIACFFFDALSYNEVYEKQLGPMKATLPSKLFEFLTPDMTRFDRPIPNEAKQPSLSIPGPDVVNLRDDKERPLVNRDIVRTFDNIGLGSNNWAVAAAKSTTGKAVLANDPHLRASIPATWYRLRLKWKGREATGVAIPGSPGITIGENGDLAWGFTNGMADHEDLVVVEVDPDNAELYSTPKGKVPFEYRNEEIEVAGEEPTSVKVKLTEWGPVVGRDWLDRPLVSKSTALSERTHNLAVFDLLRATTLEEGIEVAKRWQGPSQNVLLASKDGRIAWALSGYLVDRKGFDGKVPMSWAKGDVGWVGQIENPVIKNPASGFLFTANGRPMDALSAPKYSRVWAPAWRAARIHEMLSAQEKFSVSDLANMQLDTELRQYRRIQELIKTDIDRAVSDDVAQGATMVAQWNGKADLDSKGLHILKIFMEKLREEVFAPLLAEVADVDQKFIYNWPLKDEPLFHILEKRPLHLLAKKWESWPALFNAVFKDTVAAIKEDARFDLDSTWEEVRIVSYNHVFGPRPIVDEWINMKPCGLPGDANTVRAQATSFGASMRMVVSPGDSANGAFQMPGGQSGHFRSPHYRDHHDDWRFGRSRPLAPGKTKTSMTLNP